MLEFAVQSSGWRSSFHNIKLNLIVQQLEFQILLFKNDMYINAIH